MKSIALLSLFLTAFVSFGQITETYDNVQIQMRDGEFIEADVYLPSGPGPFEAVLIQTPYNKEAFVNLPMGLGSNVDAQPFAWIIADWRGFYGSAGADLSNFDRGEDGYDICEWIVAQSWHADRIGTWGPSALGNVQWLTMFQQHPNHVCAVPLVSEPITQYTDYFYGGCLEEARLEQLDALGYGLSPTVMANVYYSNLWQFVENSGDTPHLINIPTLQIGGWYDHNIDQMLPWYTSTRALANSSVRDQQYLLVGPWVHGGTGIAYVGSSIQGELTYPNAAGVSDDMAWDFLNYYLLDAVNGWDATPKMTYYETGSNQWLTSNLDVIPSSGGSTLYLSENEQLISSNGVGSNQFVSDPNNPTPTIGGATLHINLDQGPYDQSSLESRSDVLVFATDALTADATLTGKMIADLYLQCSQPDADIVIRLIDEYPDGRNMLITDGIKRLRFRNGYTQADEAFMTPATTYNAQVELPFTNYTFLTGHKVKIIVAGNSSIRWNVNLQDGGTMYQAGAGVTATISILHDAVNPSSIYLPGNNSTLAIGDLEKNDFLLYPNPASETIHVNTEGIQSIQLISIDGKVVTLPIQEEINISSFAAGVYHVMITTANDQVAVQRLIIQ